jgi:hypothetical protein
MKNRPHIKKAGITISAIIFILSIVDVILRATVLKEMASVAANYGEVLITAAFSLLLVIFACKGKDRIFNILCGVWLSYFVLSQVYSLPGVISDSVLCFNTGYFTGVIGNVIYALSIICVVPIGALFVEYMNDGSIYNKAFNTLCIIEIALYGVLFLLGLYNVWALGYTYCILASLHELSRMTMIFLFTFFAYDSAKAQLKKTDFTK